MQNFLQKVSGYIYENHRKNTGNLTIILPNRRAGLFLKKHLSKKFGKTIWSPAIYSIEDFVEEISGVTVLEPVTLLFEFYEIYRKSTENPQPLDEFTKWAPTLLHDFNEIDQYCIDAQNFFAFVSEERALEVWSPEKKEITDFQNQYLSFWKSLGVYYEELKTHLLAKNQAWQGLAYRVASENIAPLLMSNRGQILFAGFNALTKAEDIIIQKLIEEDKAEVLWDADEYYLENTAQEAGRFLRKRAYPSSPKKTGEKFLWCEDLLKTEEKNIEVIGVAGNATQAKVAGEILSNLNDYSNTALVLADETLLIPVLQSLPKKVKDVNVTMGYPLKHSPVHDLWDALFRLHENSATNNRRFYYKDLLKVLNHPLLNQSGEAKILTDSLTKYLTDKNRIFISEKELKAQVEPMLQPAFENVFSVFSDWNNNPQKALQCFSKLIEEFLKQSTKDEHKIEREYLYNYTKIIKRIQSLLEDYDSVKDIKTLHKIFSQIAGGLTIPFYGEPLKGLQIMGMLETRTLDFDTVILLSANEEILPSGKAQNSFVPYEIKRNFGLPTYTDKDSIFAYHFYRLLQRAKNIHLLYNTEPMNYGSSEKSRFITQLQHELPKINPKAKITEKIASISVSKSKLQPTSIEKTSIIIEKLDKLAAKGFSPSAFNTYISCPLDFYYKKILGLEEPDEVEETIEASTFGLFIHDILESFYKPFIGKIIKADDVRQMLPKAEDRTKATFLSEFSENDISFGKNLLSLKVAVKFISTFLKNESKFLETLEKDGHALTIVALEQRLSSAIYIKGNKVNIHGFADRIDKIGNTIRIIDYKSGLVQPTDLKISEIEEITQSDKKAKALQVLTYSLMYRQPVNDNQQLQSGIISFRKLSEGFMPVKINGSATISEEILKEVKEKLVETIEEIYDSSIPFAHNPDAKYCRFCGN